LFPHFVGEAARMPYSRQVICGARSLPNLVDHLGADQHADAVAQKGGEMATVFGCNEPCASLPRDFGDVRIVDPAACRFLSCGGNQELLPEFATASISSKACCELWPKSIVPAMSTLVSKKVSVRPATGRAPLRSTVPHRSPYAVPRGQQLDKPEPVATFQGSRSLSMRTRSAQQYFLNTC
jgi:hypothetical protein